MSSEVSSNIGTELLFENDRVRVWDMILQPGEESNLHQHTADYLMIYVTPSRITPLALNRPGPLPPTSEFDNNYVAYLEVGKGEGSVHQIRNDGTEVSRHILVELKGPSVAETLQQMEHNGRRS